MMQRIPPDLNAEPGKWLPCALLALVVILLPLALFLLSPDSGAQRPPAQAIKASLIPVRVVSSPAPPPPKSEPRPEAKAEPTPKKSAPPKPTVAEVALKEVQESLKAELERQRKDEERREKEQREAEKREAEREEQERREAKERVERQEAEKRQAEREERETSEQKKAQAREQAAREAQAKEAARRAAALRAQAEAEARADEIDRLARLRQRIIDQIKEAIHAEFEFPNNLRGRKDLSVRVHFRLGRDGTLDVFPSVSRSETSGFPEYDEAAIKAVLNASARFPDIIPSERDEPELTPEFREDLNLRIRPIPK